MGAGGPVTEPTRVWSARFAIGPTHNDVQTAVVGDAVVVSADDPHASPRRARAEIWLFDARSGALRWRSKRTPKGNLRLFAIVDDVVVVTATDDKTGTYSLEGLGMSDGARRWRVEFPDWDSLRLVDVEGDVFWTHSMRSVSAHNVTGDELWRVELPSRERVLYAWRYGDALVAGSGDGDLVGLDPMTGVQRWRRSFGADGPESANAFPLAPHRGEALLRISRWQTAAPPRQGGAVRQQLVVFDPATGDVGRPLLADHAPYWSRADFEERWIVGAPHTDGGLDWSSVVVDLDWNHTYTLPGVSPAGYATGTMFVHGSDDHGTLTAIDLESGFRRWSVRRWVQVVRGGPDVVYAVDHRTGDVVCLDLLSGEERWVVPNAVPDGEWGREIYLGDDFMVVKADATITTLIR